MKRHDRAVLLAIAFACLAIAFGAAGCSAPPAASSSDRKAASSPAESEATSTALGPFPLGVSVNVRGYELLLESVEVFDAETRSLQLHGTPLGYDAQGKKQQTAREGAVSVNVAVSIRGTNLDPQDTWLDQVLVVDGQATERVGAVGRLIVNEDSHVRQVAAFTVPKNAGSVILRSTPSFAESQTIDFRLW